MDPAKSQENRDEQLLAEMRDAARRFLSPWSEGQSFAELSESRRAAIRAAAEDLRQLLLEGASPVLSRQPRSRSPRRTPESDLAQITPELEKQVGVTHVELMYAMTLDTIKGFGPQKFRMLVEAGVDPETALREPERLPIGGKTGDQLRAQLRQVGPNELRLAHERAARQMVVAAELNAQVLTYAHWAYPKNVLMSNNAVPILYARGDLTTLTEERAVACVGSREIRPPYSELQEHFARYLARSGTTVVSGFAMGADTVAHRAAVAEGGRTICVMPGGLDRPFPPENRQFFDQLVSTPGAVFLSEFPFGTGASAMNLRKRNKLIVAAAKAVLVGQSSVKGGAMNAYRFGIEQRKPVATFADDHTPETTGNHQIAVEQRGSSVEFPGAIAFHKWDAWLSQLF